MDFPRLLVYSDVPVASTVGGSALLYRLLMTWPGDRLCIVEPTLFPSSPQDRLPDVDYRELRFGIPRLLRTRFSAAYAGYLFHTAHRSARRAVAKTRDFHADAVLTVAHAYSWVAAADVAKRLNIPLHLIVHDDAIKMTWVSESLAREVEKTFGEIYRAAASRLCVSPYMAIDYEKKYGAAGDVLYPGRTAGMNGFDSPPDRLAETNRPLTYAYAGTLNMPSYTQSLCALAGMIGRRGDRLLIFSNLSSEGAQRAGLAVPHVELLPIIPFKQLIDVLRTRVDCLYVPMSFDAVDRINAEIAFPSKLTDYTMIGLPLLLQGPDYCSAIRWARENGNSAVVVNNNDPARLEAALIELSSAPRRLELALSAIRLGRRYFSHEATFATFHSIICQNARQPAL